ncbi:MAG: hypothetical protein ACI9DQ_000295 [Glaciecola sp.]
MFTIPLSHENPFFLLYQNSNWSRENINLEV